MKIVFDIGATKIRFASVIDQKIDKSIVLENPGNYSEALNLIKAEFSKFVGDQKVTDAVIGIAGVVDQKNGILVKSPNLPDWNKKSIRDDFLAILGVEAIVANDADLAGLGEAVYGAGKNFDIVAYLTVSTGIGGTLITNKKINKSAFGFEPGFQIIDYKSGKTFHEIASGKALEEQFGMKPRDMRDPKFWKEFNDWLSYALYNLIIFWSPECIVLGGGQMRDVSIDQINSKLRETMTIFESLPQIKESGLGDENGLYGAIALLENRL